MENLKLHFVQSRIALFNFDSFPHEVIDGQYGDCRPVPYTEFIIKLLF